MVDFNTPTATYATQRLYKPITDFSKFAEVKSAFLDDETMGLTVQTLKSESYTDYVNLIKGDDKVIIRVDSTNPTQRTTALAKFDDAFAVSILGTGATAAADASKRNWKMVFNGVTAALDPFTLTVDESFTNLNGYHDENTCTVVEAWADTVEALSTEVN